MDSDTLSFQFVNLLSSYMIIHLMYDNSIRVVGLAESAEKADLILAGSVGLPSHPLYRQGYVVAPAGAVGLPVAVSDITVSIPKTVVDAQNKMISDAIIASVAAADAEKAAAAALGVEIVRP